MNTPNIWFAFTILFLAIGPLRVLPLFDGYTESADRRYRFLAALIATAIASVIVVIVAIAGAGTLDSWHVSTAALDIAIGILLLRSTFTSIAHLESLMTPSQPAHDVVKERPSPAALAFSPIAVPNIVSATRVVTIALFLSLARSDATLQWQIYLVLAVLLALNFVGMLSARFIMRVLKLPTLVVVGWIFAALQTALAVELILKGLHLTGFTSH